MPSYVFKTQALGGGSNVELAKYSENYLGACNKCAGGYLEECGNVKGDEKAAGRVCPGDLVCARDPYAVQDESHVIMQKNSPNRFTNGDKHKQRGNRTDGNSTGDDNNNNSTNAHAHHYTIDEQVKAHKAASTTLYRCITPEVETGGDYALTTSSSEM